MGDFTAALKQFWLWMFSPPWKHDRSLLDTFNSYHWTFWLIGWAWTVAGLVAGALAAPQLLQSLRLSGSPYRDEMVIGVAVGGGILVQVFGWFYVALVTASLIRFLRRAMEVAIDYGRGAPAPQGPWMPSVVVSRRRIAYYVILALLPLAVVGYSIDRYLASMGADQRTFAVAFVGGLLIKAFIIPPIWGTFKSTAFQRFMKWLRGGKDTKKTD